MTRAADANWGDLRGGYRVPYDPRPTIAALRADPLNQALWDELWNQLHHQGDVGEASYAAVPLLIEACAATPRNWNFYGLIAIIESERDQRRNPAVPEWLAPAYRFALVRARDLALGDLANTSDRDLLRTATAVVALVSGDRELGSVLARIDSSEITEWLERY